MIGKTLSSVHDEAELQAQRGDALAKEQCALAGMAVYAQIFLGLALYLYDHVSTPGYFSLFLTFPYQILLILWARKLVGRVAGDGGVLSLTGSFSGKFLTLLLFLSALLDALIVFFGMNALIADMMTDLPPWAAPLTVVLFTSLSLMQPGNHALPRLSRVLRWIVGGMLLYCFAAALPHGRADHFFPLLGYGIERIGQGAVWMCGAVSGCCAPLLMAGEESALRPLQKKKSTLYLPVLLSLSAGIVTMLVSVWLMPVSALAQPHTLGWKIMLVTHMTPSVAAWSLEFLGLTLMLLLALCENLDRASRLLARSGGRRQAPRLLTAALTWLLLPTAFLPAQTWQRVLIALAPYRAAIPVIVLGVLTFSSRKNKRRIKAG